MILFNSIFFLRHFKTYNNDMHIISGQSDSKIIYENILKVNLNKFDLIFCSPSLRCKQTIELISNDDIDIHKIIYDKRLLERNMGSLEGMTKSECKSKLPDLFMNETFNIFSTPPNGESYECFRSRVEDFYHEYLQTNEQLNILVCSHNQTLKLLRLFILGKKVSYKTWIEYTFRNGEIEKIT